MLCPPMHTTPRTVADWAEAVRAAVAQSPGASAAYVWDLAFRLHARHPGASVHVEDGVLEVWHPGALDHVTTGWERVSA